MKFFRLLSVLALLNLSLPVFGLSANADEGMWTFDRIPRAEIKKRYGFEINDAWLKKVQLASVRFTNGGSGSFVSPDGLVLTNQHVALETLQQLSTKQKDYVKDGFYARTRADALKAPDLELNVLLNIEDVTAFVESAGRRAKAGDTEAARRTALNEIREQRSKETGLRGEVMTLYGGTQYHLYLYKRYTDVRLEFAPEFAIAYFGNENDNFKYPRYALDMALFRVYENDKPVSVQNFFKLSHKGPKAKELLFVTGNPGASFRQSIAPQLEHLRDVTYPLFINRLEQMRSVLQRYSALGPEQARSATSDLFQVENGLKAMNDQYQALQRKSLIEKKIIDAESERHALVAEPPRAKEYEEAYQSIARAYQGFSSYERDYYLFDGGWAFDSSLFLAARIIVRIAIESTKPNDERLPAFTDSRRAGLLQFLYSSAPVNEDLEKAKLTGSLSMLRDQLGADSPVTKRILNDKTPATRSSELVNGTRLADAEFRKQMVAGGLRMIEQSTDAMIALAFSIEPETRAVRQRYQTNVADVERDAYAKLARLVLGTRGELAYPEANFTLRLTYGAVRGYRDHESEVAPFTNFAGLFADAQQHGNREPYQLPDSWLKNKAVLDLHTPLDFISTHDVALGASGSPVINRRAEIVGIIFDVNSQSLGNNFGYDETQARSICLDVRGIVESLDKVYAAKRIMDELR